jgi:sugar phosphate isomerase/epimerase
LHSDDVVESLLSLLDDCGDGRLGVEIFPLCHEDGFYERLDRFSPRLREIPVTFHEPYYFAEHSQKKGTPEYLRTVGYCEKLFGCAAALNAGHMVYHLNNCEVSGRRAAMAANALANLCEMGRLAKSFGLDLLVENTGVRSLNNVLFDEREFAALFGQWEYGCLLDVGHANCNDWDIESLMRGLGGKIKAFHLHNNYGITDDHNRIFDGTLDMGHFFRSYNRHARNANIILEYRPELLEGDISWLRDDISWVFEKAGSASRDLSKEALVYSF